MNVIEEDPDEIFKRAEIFDIYRGKQVDNNKKSVAIRLFYGHDEKTLKDEEVTAVHRTILSRLADKLNASLREQ